MHPYIGFPFSLVPSSTLPFSTLLWDHFPKPTCLCALVSGSAFWVTQAKTTIQFSLPWTWKCSVVSGKPPIYRSDFAGLKKDTSKPFNCLVKVPRQSEGKQNGTQVKTGSWALSSYCPMGTGKPSLNSSQGQLSLEVEGECQAGNGSWLEAHWWAGQVGGMESSHLPCHWSQSLVKSLSVAFMNHGEGLHVLKAKQ